MAKTYRIGVIGLGNMGARYLRTLHDSPRWQIVWAADMNPDRLDWARNLVPGIITDNHADDLLQRCDIDVLGIFTLADVRPHFIEIALQRGIHVIAEKPLAATVEEEEHLLRVIDASNRLVAVNLFNRNAWYHHQIQEFIREGQIGQLAILNISHQTPGLMPTQGHVPEGPPFRDCGMHYVDLARWYAGSEFDRWDAQGIRMWGWHEPWWVNAHGSFKNGTVFSITQGFTYGQMAQTPVIRSGLEAIGTLGVVRMQHDFHEVVIEYHGVSHTETKKGPYTSKNIDILCQQFAESIDAGRNIGFPTARDSVIASKVSQAMLDFARERAAPIVGTLAEMEQILQHKENLERAQ